MVDLLTYLNVNVLGLKAFHLNLFKGGMIALLLAIGVSILATDRTSQYILYVTGRLNAATVKQQRMMGWGGGVAFTGFLIYLRVRQYFELQTMYDMTVEANVAWHMVHGPWFFNSLDHDSFLGGHFSLVFFLIGAIYRWAEHPITLLVIQSVALGGGAVAVYYIALARKTTTSVAVLAIALYVFNPYVHHISAHDFHLSPLAIPAILWMLYFIDSAQPWKAAAAALLSPRWRRAFFFRSWAWDSTSSRYGLNGESLDWGLPSSRSRTLWSSPKC
jgi:Predicted membrane protein